MEALQAGEVDAARERCETMDDGLWRDECWFVVAENEPLDVGVRTCRQAGRFRHNCLDHLWFQAQEQVPTTAVGEEAALRESLDTVARQVLPAARRADQVERALLDKVRLRFDDGATRADCGTLPEDRCSEALLLHLRHLAPTDEDRLPQCADFSLLVFDEIDGSWGPDVVRAWCAQQGPERAVIAPARPDYSPSR